MQRMHETGTRKVELARLPGVRAGAVRRLRRLDQRSRFGRIEAALGGACGSRCSCARRPERGLMSINAAAGRRWWGRGFSWAALGKR
jgi:hypothetical protein